MVDRAGVADAMLMIEKELRVLQLWSSETPSPERLSSTQPFSVDTLSFPEWLQFIFLPNMKILLEAGADLPANCSISPMAETYFNNEKICAQTLLQVIEDIDHLLTQSARPSSAV